MKNALLHLRMQWVKVLAQVLLSADMQVTLTNDGPVTIWYDTLD